MRSPFFVLIFVLGILIIVLGLNVFNQNDTQLASSVLVTVNDFPSGFTRAAGPREWFFPEDLGPHQDYQTEWWYYTGNVKSSEGRIFGYQLTFFRRALLPEQERTERPSSWAAEHIYMAHFALSNIDKNEHQAFERFARGSAGLAGSKAQPYKVWLEDWYVTQISKDVYQISAKQGGFEIDLTLEDLKGPIFHGEQGYSQKGPEIGNASYYFSMPRLRTSGEIQTPDGTYNVNGWSWMDHEFSTSALSAGQVGWDWFSIQLEDSSEFMLFQIRRDDQSIDPYSSGTIVKSNGKSYYIIRDDFSIEVLDYWQSPYTGAEYPAGWRIRIPAHGLELEILPLQSNQEMDLSFPYWEGAVRADGFSDGLPISGLGYVELTGYARSMEGEF